MKLIKYSLILLLFLSLLSCRAITRPEVNAVETHSWVDSSIKNIGVATFKFDKDLVLPETTKYQFEKAIQQTLQDYGYSVQSSDSYKRIASKIRKNYGAFYDPVTGTRNDKEINNFKLTASNEFSHFYQLDMLLDVYLVKKQVHYKNSTAKWDNTIDNFDVRGSSFGNSGITPAISIIVKATNLHTGQVFKRAQGLQVIIDKVFDIDGKFDIHPDDLVIHKENIKLALVQFDKNKFLMPGRKEE